MNFFERVAALATEKIQLQIGITVENGNTIVSVVPVTRLGNNVAVDKKYWPAFVMRGTPQTLDAEFEKNIAALEDALPTISNAADYAETVKKEAEANKAKSSKTAKPADKKDSKPKEEEKKEDDGLTLFDE